MAVAGRCGRTNPAACDGTLDAQGEPERSRCLGPCGLDGQSLGVCGLERRSLDVGASYVYWPA